MRLLVIVLTFLLFVGIVGFVLTNLDTRVPVTVWETQYTDLPLFLLGIIAVFVGICYAGIIGVAEGASIRLANRRLAHEVQRLEAELDYLRAQPPPAPRPEPDSVQEAPEPAPSEEDGGRPVESVATAPVYGPDTEGWVSDDDEDAYSGGRAV